MFFSLVVAKVVPQVVPSVTPDDARRLFHESKENGTAIVIVTVKVCMILFQGWLFLVLVRLSNINTIMLFSAK